MTNFISYLYIKTNQISEEKICVGLFAKNSNVLYFNYSKDKLSIASKLLSIDIKANILNTLKKISKDVDSFNIESKSTLYLKNEYTLEFFKYLNTYSSGLLNYTAPKTISSELNLDSFTTLFKNSVDSSDKKNRTEKKISFKIKVNNLLSLKGFNKVDTNYEMTPEIITSFYANHKVDFIGKNGVIIAGKTIDFNASPFIIDNNLHEFERISRGLNNFIDLKNLGDKGEYTAYFSKTESKEAEKVLNIAIKDKNKGYKLKMLEELEETSKKIELGNYLKFSAII